MASPDNQAGASQSPGAAGGTSSSSSIQGATSAVSNIAQQATERVRDQASHAAGQAQEHAQAFLSEQKEVAADHIEGVAKVLHETVDQLRQRSPGAVTDYAERAVGGLDSVANALREQDVRALVGQVEDFARRQPVLFLAGTVAIGFALARFLKSSSRGGYGAFGQGPGQYGSRGQSYGGAAAGDQSSSTGMGGTQRRTEFSRHMDTGSGQGSPAAASASDYRSSSNRSSGPTGSANPDRRTPGRESG